MTAVEYIKKRIEEDSDTSFSNIDWDKFDEIINKAKEMEKEQSLKMPIYNLDDLADEYCTYEPRNTKELRDVNLIKLGFRDGFQKAIELLTFKK